MRILGLILFLSTLPLMGRAGTWRQNPRALVVKVTSSFDRASELKLEGSGVLLKDEGQIYVLTSEHVVVPGNAPAVHEIQLPDGRKGEAEWVTSSWSKGLALLRLKSPGSLIDRDEDGFDVPEVDRDLYRYFAIEAPEYEYQAYGYPSGVTEPYDSKVRLSQAVTAAGEVLADQRVYGVPDILAEFGMSGGPVFVNGGDLFGILTHTALGPAPATYIIPVWDLAEWARNPFAGGIVRTVDDLKRFLFTRDHAESLHIPSLRMALAKRQGEFHLSLADFGPPGSPPPAGSGVARVFETMREKGWAAARVTRFRVKGNDFPANASMSLARFVHLLLRTDTEVTLKQEIDQGEGPELTLVVRRTGPVATRFFFEGVDQSVTYELTRKRAGRTERGTMTSRITGIGYGPAKTVSDRVSWSQGPGSRADVRHPVLLMAKEFWFDLKGRCVREGGTLGTTDVPAGIFETCTKIEKGWKNSYGPVPVDGIVKAESVDGRERRVLVDLDYK